MWACVDSRIKNHPRTRELTHLLQCSRLEAIGVLVAVWLWGLENADECGKVRHPEDIALDIGAAFSSKELVDALLAPGWMTATDNADVFVLVDSHEWRSQWDAYQGQLEKDRARKQRSRSKGGGAL